MSTRPRALIRPGTGRHTLSPLLDEPIQFCGYMARWHRVDETFHDSTFWGGIRVLVREVKVRGTEWPKGKEVSLDHVWLYYQADDVDDWQHSMKFVEQFTQAPEGVELPTQPDWQVLGVGTVDCYQRNDGSLDWSLINTPALNMMIGKDKVLELGQAGLIEAAIGIMDRLIEAGQVNRLIYPWGYTLSEAMEILATARRNLLYRLEKANRDCGAGWNSAITPYAQSRGYAVPSRRERRALTRASRKANRRAQARASTGPVLNPTLPVDQWL